MKFRASQVGRLTDPEPPASLRASYRIRRERSVAAVRAAVAALAAEGRPVTLAAIEQVSHGLPEGAVTAKTVLRNPECRALYVTAASTDAKRKIRRSERALRAELALVANQTGDAAHGDVAAPTATTPPSAAELRRARRLDRRSKGELAAMVIRLEREVALLHRHNVNLRDYLLRHDLGRGGEGNSDPAPRVPSDRPMSGA